MANVYNSILRYGLQAAYEALETKDANVLYFCTDTGKIYKGAVDFTNSVVAAAAKPTTPIVGKVYVLADTDTVEVYVGGKWKVLSYPIATTVTASSDDVHVASAKAVYDAIQAAVADLAGSVDTVKAIGAGTEDAKVKVTKGDDSVAEFVVPGVVTTPTWDATARKLTLPVSAGTAVEVNIGKDIFIDPTADNKYNPETGNIEIHLNDGSDDSDATMLSIPASALVDVYTGAATNGASVTVSDENVISVSVTVDPVEGNALVLTKDGLKVDLAGVTAAAAAAQTAADDAQAAADAAQADADTNAAAIAVLNGDDATDGSVAKAVADAVATVNGAADALAGRVTTLEGEMDTAQADITANAENIAALATASTTWGTF